MALRSVASRARDRLRERSFAIDRFGYELCHRGLPLASLTVGTPDRRCRSRVSWALFKRSRAWVVAVKVAALALNAWQLASALIVVAGIGIAACG
jgi:hypothetical protein